MRPERSSKLIFVLAYLVIIASFASAGATPAISNSTLAATASPDLSGVWLPDSVVLMQPHFFIRSKLTLTRNAFSLVGYLGVKKPWTGTFTLGAGGEARNLDLQTAAFDMSERGTSEVYPASSVHGIYKLSSSPDGDRLTICFALHGGPRPADFQATDNTRLITLLRVEPDFQFPNDVIVTALDPSGRPAPGAGIFHYMNHGYGSKTTDNGRTWFIDMKSPQVWLYDDVAKTGSGGTARLSYDAFKNAAGVPSGAHDALHHWTGFARVSPASLRRGTLAIRMQPERMIRGTITCDALTQSGKPIPWRYAYLFPYDNRIAWCLADTGPFEFPAPPGEYSLYTYGNDLESSTQSITVPPGTGDFVLPPISLVPAKILAFVGNPAPVLRGVLAWKNGAVDVTALKGKIVLLNFWGYWCGNCVEEMPTLMRLYDKYKDKGLAIVSVHVDSFGEVDTVAKLDQKTSMYRNNDWKGRDVLFPIALVSGRFRDTGHCLAAADYCVQFYPTTIVIGRDGKVLGDLGDQVDVNLNADDKTIDAGIDQLLAGK